MKGSFCQITKLMMTNESSQQTMSIQKDAFKLILGKIDYVDLEELADTLHQKTRDSNQTFDGVTYCEYAENKKLAIQYQDPEPKELMGTLCPPWLRVDFYEMLTPVKWRLDYSLLFKNPDGVDKLDSLGQVLSHYESNERVTPGVFVNFLAQKWLHSLGVSII